MSKRIEVFVRIRPGLSQINNCIWRGEEGRVYRVDKKEETCFSGYEGVFVDEKNIGVYQRSIKHLVDKFLEEENSTVFAYGQTGAGKTYTILGEEEDGIIHLCLKDILEREEVSVSYLEIYNEKIYDLCTNNELRIYTVNNIHTVSNLTSTPICSQQALYEYLVKCETNRKYGSTEFNLRSSRSHTVFQVKLRESTFNLIDLAGSEKASANESRRKEGGFINKSLLALCNLVTNLQNNKCLGFRDSKLTRILQPSLNGKTNIVALCMINPRPDCIEESIATLKFAGRLANLIVRVTTQARPVRSNPVIEVKIHKTEMKQGYYNEQYSKHYMSKEDNKDENGNKEDNKDGDGNKEDSKDGDGSKEVSKDGDGNKEVSKDGDGSKEVSKDGDDNKGDQGKQDTTISHPEMAHNTDTSLNDPRIFEEESSESVEFMKKEHAVDFYIPGNFCDTRNENQFEEEKTLLLERINSLEKMVTEMLKKYPSKRTREIFILEKHMFNLKLKKYEERKSHVSIYK